MITTIEELEALPGDLVIIASGTYPTGGTFTECHVRKVPAEIVGAEGLWQVLVWGDSGIETLVRASNIALPATLLIPATISQERLSELVGALNCDYWDVVEIVEEVLHGLGIEVSDE